ncbi:hypothetical protein [Flavobacterium sp.]|uniref:hypothetical protein n=1 Tax=Flavobacterium sp. TaxID=239 RepID=UPI003752EA51
MKKKLILLVFFIIYSSFSQDYENKFVIYQDSIKKEFKQNGITEYLFLSNNCPSNLAITKDGFKDININVNVFEAYLIWKKETKIFMKKISNNENFRIIYESANFEIINFNPFKFIYKHKSKISNEKVLDNIINDNGEEITFRMTLQCNTIFNIYLNSLYIENYFVESNLIKSNYLSDDGKPYESEGLNMNYEFNNNLKMIRLFRKLNLEIAKIKF